ncbi:hypothetical protein GCM10011414_29370 [Croceivirga lutea]|uniref:RDD family protein n=1 Tax=Croceivirga lutea TaxID=1775167 RepID=UPI00163B02DF|nr:RDD family protein [Croceivirga lutea]GGG57662.1 hypothetical protein GCM10011414_29370 [Croceivirga lutea]
MSLQYAMLPDRIKAVVIDSVILISAMYAVSELFALFSEVPNTLRMVVFVVIFILYDPLFTSLNGATIGHTYSNISVQQDNEIGKRISFPIALLRFILKSTLGWLSLLTVTSNEKRKALHDIVANSVVIENKK